MEKLKLDSRKVQKIKLILDIADTVRGELRIPVNKEVDHKDKLLADLIQQKIVTRTKYCFTKASAHVQLYNYRYKLTNKGQTIASLMEALYANIAKY